MGTGREPHAPRFLGYVHAQGSAGGAGEGDFLTRYDRPETLFYLDPPYWGSEDYYIKDAFTQADFAKLSAALQQLQGKWLLSINDVPQIREIFSWAKIDQVELTYTLAGGDDAKTVSELIISRK